MKDSEIKPINHGTVIQYSFILLLGTVRYLKQHGKQNLFFAKTKSSWPQGIRNKDFRGKTNRFPQDIQSFIIFALIQCSRVMIPFLLRKREKSIRTIYSKFYYSALTQCAPKLFLR